MTVCQLLKYALPKLIYEITGTYFFAMIFIATNGNAPFPLFLTQWIITAFCIRVSGSHFNPAVSLAYALRRDIGGISRKLAIFYMVAQSLGALLAGFTLLWLKTKFDGVSVL